MFVMPAVIPVTFPEASTLALPLLADQLPPDVASNKEIGAPVQTDAGPLMAAGADGTEITFTAIEVDAVPQLFVME